jgi:large subunit ribosomal protein L19e
MKNLNTQKRLSAELLGVGENKVIFDSSRLDDISKAITRQDIADLIKDKAIIKRITGKSKKKKENLKRGTGNVKVRVKNRKKKYMAKIRKLRRYLSEIKDKNVISTEEYQKLRRLSKSGQFKTRRHLMEHLTVVMKRKLPEFKKIGAKHEKAN